MFKKSNIFFVWNLGGSVKETDINVSIAGYGKKIMKWKSKKAISLAPKPGDTENKKAFKQRTLNKLKRL
jgi:hypothetical protein